jgi:hypothetical protein
MRTPLTQLGQWRHPAVGMGLGVIHEGGVVSGSATRRMGLGGTEGRRGRALVGESQCAVGDTTTAGLMSFSGNQLVCLDGHGPMSSTQ